MKEKKLKIKDLVTIGVFAVIYFVVTFAVGMIGVIPILFLIYPTILGIVSGTVVTLGIVYFRNAVTYYYACGRPYLCNCTSCICSNDYSRVDKKNRSL